MQQPQRQEQQQAQRQAQQQQQQQCKTTIHHDCNKKGRTVAGLFTS